MCPENPHSNGLERRKVSIPRDHLPHGIILEIPPGIPGIRCKLNGLRFLLLRQHQEFAFLVEKAF